MDADIRRAATNVRRILHDYRLTSNYHVAQSDACTARLVVYIDNRPLRTFSATVVLQLVKGLAPQVETGPDALESLDGDSLWRAMLRDPGGAASGDAADDPAPGSAAGDVRPAGEE